MARCLRRKLSQLLRVTVVSQHHALAEAAAACKRLNLGHKRQRYWVMRPNGKIVRRIGETYA